MENTDASGQNSASSSDDPPLAQGHLPDESQQTFGGFTIQSDNVVLADKRNRLAAEVSAMENKKEQLQEKLLRRRRSDDTGLKTCAIGSIKFLPMEELCGICEIHILGKVLGDNDLKALHTSKKLTRIRNSKYRGVCDVQLLADLKQLQEVHLEVDGEIRNMTSLSRLPELRKVLLSNPNIYDSDMHCLGLLQNLEELSLRNCYRVTSCQRISQLPLLRVLDISFTRVTNEELTGLSASRSLVKVVLLNCRRLTDVSPLASIRTLEEVYLSGSEGVRSFGALGRLPVLRLLDFGCTAITDEELRCLSGSRSLVKVVLRHCRYLTDVSPLASVETLEEVDLSGCEGVRTVGALGRLPVLRVLDLGSAAITYGELQGLSASCSLVKIVLQHCRYLTDVSPLASIETLEEVYLFGSERVKIVGALGRLPVLRVLDLGSAAITDWELQRLSASRSLVKIVLQHCRYLTDVSPLASIRTLEEVYLSGCERVRSFGALGTAGTLQMCLLSHPLRHWKR
ncbi:leucine-rich repeat protein 1 (LRRP1) [Trypanosoma grayi]|uniref:leucine-rich repeat protein 1 (LRRP1) n=1 Tax=Trypanosoma grayi TaxID=71804 RepID=UPI0004F40E19|nr:leucine-rich repeat protein 1 (LRRP1) [Trypanosoma grayi]KEG12366.1 leucine-rich repeat protein 1 (LRRP1) [Trypanosoma grayi]